jgi:hypothetical protein
MVTYIYMQEKEEKMAIGIEYWLTMDEEEAAPPWPGSRPKLLCTWPELRRSDTHSSGIAHGLTSPLTPATAPPGQNCA